MADVNGMTAQQAADAATRAIWNALTPAAQAAIEADMSAGDRKAVKQAIDRAKRIK
jgi:hypothetical protein